MTRLDFFLGIAVLGIGALTVCLDSARTDSTTVTMPSAVLEGHVEDECGMPMPEVTVILPGTKRGTRTDELGRFRARGHARNGVRPASWRSGMRSRIDTLRIRPGERKRLSLRLTPRDTVPSTALKDARLLQDLSDKLEGARSVHVSSWRIRSTPPRLTRGSPCRSYCRTIHPITSSSWRIVQDRGLRPGPRPGNSFSC